jgi:hypothetical protein
MSKPPVPALSLLLPATAGRNMTRPAHVAVGVAIMVRHPELGHSIDAEARRRALENT